MKIEQASPEVHSAIAAALEVPLPSVATRWLELAAHERLPLIVGWDLRGGRAERCVKLYVNASDVAEGRRAHLSAALVPDVAFGGTPPAVLGRCRCVIRPATRTRRSAYAGPRSPMATMS